MCREAYVTEAILAIHLMDIFKLEINTQRGQRQTNIYAFLAQTDFSEKLSLVVAFNQLEDNSTDENFIITW